MNNQVDITVHVTVASPAAQCFDYIVPVELSHIFRPYLLLPGVERTDETERWFTPGLSRTVHFTDGSKAKEQLLTVEPSQSFTYEISEFTGINKFLVSSIYGAWKFSQNSASTTDIQWTYSLVCHNAATRLIVQAIVAPMLKRYLQRALRVIEQDLKKSSTKSSK